MCASPFSGRRQSREIEATYRQPGPPAESCLLAQRKMRVVQHCTSAEIRTTLEDHKNEKAMAYHRHHEPEGDRGDDGGLPATLLCFAGKHPSAYPNHLSPPSR